MYTLTKKIYYKVAKIWCRGEKYAKTYNIRKAKHQGVRVGTDCRFYSTDFSTEPYLIEIGNHVTITAGVRFITHDGAAWVLRGLENKFKNINIVGKIKVGNNVFIGFDSLILPGVEIGDNTIVAAGSVVTKSFDNNVVIGGVPAKVIKTLDEYIQLNKNCLVDTKNLNSIEKKRFIMEEMNKDQFRNKG